MQPALADLLAGLIDYAGLFPPASLPLPRAARIYGRELGGPWAPLLGRFIVPAARLEELAAIADTGSAGRPWPLSVLPAAPWEAARRHLDALAGRSANVRIEAIELPVEEPEEVASAARAFAGLELFLEVPIREGRLEELLAAIAEQPGVRAKIRTGGVVAEAIPSAAAVARFLSATVAAGVPFKATAGLHHPLPGSYPLTYEPDSPQGAMHGFLNVFLLAALLRQEPMDQAESERLLALTEPPVFTAMGVDWGGHHLERQALIAARRATALSYGSCSFHEPIEDLTTLGLLAKPER